MSSRKAVIDLGTNTCNLLIAEPGTNGIFRILYQGKEAVKLGSGGIHKNQLHPEAIRRGLDALARHAQTLAQFNTTDVSVFATSALRGAENKDEFLQQVNDKLGWKIDVINGKREAELIFKGVSLSLPKQNEKFIILDIGGGSNEFILVEQGEIIWKESFNIGMARVLEKFKPSDPIKSIEAKAIEQWFNENLTPLWQACALHHPKTLVGCSGAFDTFIDIHEQQRPMSSERISASLPINAYRDIHHKLLSSTIDQRNNMKGMDPMRVEMIVYASIFVNFVIEKLNVKQLIQSNFSLKEGAMSELL